MPGSQTTAGAQTAPDKAGMTMTCMVIFSCITNQGYRQMNKLQHAIRGWGFTVHQPLQGNSLHLVSSWVKLLQVSSHFLWEVGAGTWRITKERCTVSPCPLLTCCNRFVCLYPTSLQLASQPNSFCFVIYPLTQECKEKAKLILSNRDRRLDCAKASTYD